MKVQPIPITIDYKINLQLIVGVLKLWDFVCGIMLHAKLSLRWSVIHKLLLLFVHPKYF